MKLRSKGLLRLTAIVLAVLVAGLATALMLFPSGPPIQSQGMPGVAAPPDPAPPPPAAEPAPSAPDEREAVIAAVEGTVERQRGEEWASVKVGDTVKAEDSLRTAPAAHADLQIGDASRLTVSEDTQVKIAELTAAVHRLKIKRGRVAAAYQADGARVLRIEGESGEAVVEARAAQFAVRATESSFAVATETGTVNLKAADTVVAVGPGQVSVAPAGRAPSPAAPIPTEVLLKVAAAALPGAAAPCSVIQGEASPGSEVRIEGEPAALGPDGRFRTPFDAKGRKEVRVVMRDLMGNQREKTLVCAAQRPPQDRPQPIEKMNIQWE